MEKTFKYIYIVILSLIAIFALVVILSTSNFFGQQAYVVKTGSMSPKIPPGSLTFDIKERNYRIGDAITFISPDTSQVTNTDNLVTHRIVSIKQVGTVTYYRVKGDANNAPDPSLVPKDDVVGKVRFSIPKIGYLVDFIKTLPGIIIFIIIPATIIVYEEMRKIKNEIVRIRKEAKLLEREAIQEERRISRWFTKLRSFITSSSKQETTSTPQKKTKKPVKKRVTKQNKE